MLNEFSNKIMPYIAALADYKFGLRKKSAIITKVCGTTDLHFDNGVNSFLFTLPMGLNDIKWQFIFDLENLQLPPDIISEDGFYEIYNSTDVLAKIPCLSQWDPKNENCVLQLVLEMLNLFQAYNWFILNSTTKSNSYRLQYDILKKSVNPEDIELSIMTPRMTPVCICIGLKFDASDLPIRSAVIEGHMACVSFQWDITDELPDISLTVCKELEQLIGPTYINIEKLDYSEQLNDIQKTLERKILLFRQKYFVRKELLNLCRDMDQLQILEVDDELFTKISFFLKDDTKLIICLIELPSEFPSTDPQLSIISKGKPIELDFNSNMLPEDSEEKARFIIDCFMEHLRPSESNV